MKLQYISPETSVIQVPELMDSATGRFSVYNNGNSSDHSEDPTTPGTGEGGFIWNDAKPVNPWNSAWED